MFSDIKNVKEFSHSSSSDVSNHHAVLFHFGSWLNFVLKNMLQNASHVKMLGNKFVEQTDRVDQCHQWFCLFVAFVLHVRYAAVSAHGSAFAQVNCSKWHQRDLMFCKVDGPKGMNEFEFSALVMILWNLYSFLFEKSLSWAMVKYTLNEACRNWDLESRSTDELFRSGETGRDFDACRVFLWLDSKIMPKPLIFETLCQEWEDFATVWCLKHAMNSW